MILRAGLVGGVASLAVDLAWNSITPAVASDLCYLGAIGVGTVIWASVGYVASRGVSIRSGSAGAVVALAIDAVIADWLVPTFALRSVPPETWAPTTVVAGALLAASAGALGGLIARARRTGATGGRSGS